MPPITPATLVGDLLEQHPAAAHAFVRHGMACVGCSMARFETIADAAAQYSLDPESFVREIIRSCSTHPPAVAGRPRRRRGPRGPAPGR